MRRPKFQRPIPSMVTGGVPEQVGRAIKRSRSPLTRKIIIFNLVTLSLLVSGILFLSQSRASLIDLRKQTLLADASVLATSLEFQMGFSEIADLYEPTLYITLEALAEPINARAQLFSPDGHLITDIGARPEVYHRDESPITPRANTLSDIFNDAWTRLAAVFVTQPAPADESYLMAFRSAIAIRSMIADDSTMATTMNEVKQLIVTVAVPVSHDGDMVGAVVLSTLGGEIDEYIWNERQQILEVFLLAALTSVFLSILLANTIGRPLRQLAMAAQKGSVQNSGRINPGRIDIPDLTSRPDEIGDLSRQLRNMTTALYDRIEANEAFAADVAHEIKNPLTSLGSAVETMRLVKDDNARERLLDVIRDDVNRMDRLVTDISNASRLDAELATDEMVSINVVKMLQDLVDYQSELAAADGVSLVPNFDETTPNIIGLESRLAQVFVNLITNAISFVPEGGSVTVSVFQHEHGEVAIVIEDTGCGIPKDNLEDVFKRFYSSRPEQDFGNNSGLGLSISKQIVEAHGGEIWAENIYGDGPETPSGARFTVLLPV
jgi:two-component system sensor histidine kinase ChvG